MKQKKDPSPSTSTSRPGSGASTPSIRDQVDTFLDGVLPREESRGKDFENETSSSKVDISKAGLPTRPYFESSGPPREL